MSDKKFSFDIDQTAIQALAKVLKDADLTEIEYEDQGRRLRLTRSTTMAMAPAMVPSAVSHVVATSSASSSETAAPNPKQHPGALKSPMVGTLYTSPEPGAAPFARVGSKVNQGDTVVIIEAMKVMNPIKAHRGGTVKEIFFNDASPVEYGDILMIIE